VNLKVRLSAEAFQGAEPHNCQAPDAVIQLVHHGERNLRSIADLRGLRFPDMYVVRMLFKEGLQRRQGSVLELGCGSGNNLLPFADFGWDVTGLDISRDALSDARHNLDGVGTFIECDLATDFPLPEDKMFDAILLPNIIYYLPRRSFTRVLQECRRRIRPEGVLLLIARTREDWRYGRGLEQEPGGYRLDCRETGEYGLLNVFYDADELSALVREHFGELRDSHRLFATCDNPQAGIVVRNADVVIWGRAVGA
jgi:SAM-dependent methyltransferase